MYSVWIHTVAFLQVVVLNCIQPINWNYCYRIDRWLIPDLIHAWELKTKKIVPYQQEKEYLEFITKEKNLD